MTLFLMLYNPVFLPDPELSWLQHRAQRRQRTSRAPGTWRNHDAMVATYIAFCHRYAIPPAAPHHTQICAFVEYLAIHMAAPASIRNAVSHVRVHLRLRGANMQQVEHPRVTRALEAIDRDKTYTPRTRPPVTMNILRDVLDGLQSDTKACCVRVGLLLMYYAALRQSEVAPRSVRAFDPSRNLTRGDIQVHTDRVVITIRMAKNLQRVGQSKQVCLYRADVQALCPVQSVKAMIARVPTTSRDEPLLMFDNRRPVPVTFISNTWSAGLRALTVDPQRYTLHGLRRAAATQAFQGGCSELDIQRYRGWWSDAHRDYIQPDDNHRVNQMLLRALARQ
jgi:integrase